MQDKSMNASLKKLLETAEEMILDKGCRATTLQGIADRSGLTKGAIYHYVKSKEELFALILESGVEKTNRLFYESVSRATDAAASIQAPLSALSSRLMHLSSTDNAANLIFIYLLSQKDKPGVADILKRYQETAIRSAAQWIEVGQQHGVIPPNLHAEKAARFLSIFKSGLQVQQIVSPDDENISDEEIYAFMAKVLG